ncbi:MAG: anthranilate synthase component I family protein [Phycisphaerae bacterium]|nr:anthranilate synthase component I family protein [Phycisphaerae bacterium]
MVYDCRLVCEKQKADIPLQNLTQYFSQMHGVTILGANVTGSESDRFSYWMAAPRDIFEFLDGDTTPFEKLDGILGKYRLVEKGDNLPFGIFCGGWAGFFGYELGRYIENLPRTARDELQMPLIRLCFYDRLICYDNKENCFWLISIEIEGDLEPVRKKLSWLRSAMEKSADALPEKCRDSDVEKIDFTAIASNMSRDYYIDAVKKIKRYIYDGDIYQVNFSQRFECDYKTDAAKLFHWQNAFNPSGFAAYIDTGTHKIVSASPEMFITVNSSHISTLPIKGTRKRLLPDDSKSIEINQKNFEELVACEKEKAELNMIVDLERNDLSRICVPGSIRWSDRFIETYPTVFHAQALVKGLIRENIDLCDVLRAVFPGGSITGAPKIRAMEIIDELEPAQRGIYTGSIGFIGLDGNTCLNIAIRTIIITSGTAYAQAGGGIVADSDPQAEYEECQIKARALLAGIISCR